MRSRAKASSAGSTDGSGKRRGLLRRALATRGASGDAKGSGAVSRRLAPLGLLGALTIAISAFFAVAAANAETPTTTITSVTGASYASVQVEGKVDPKGEPTGWGYQVSTDGGTSWQGTNIGGSFEGVSGPQDAIGEITGLKPGTTFQLRLIAINSNDSSEGISAEPNPEFTTLSLDPPTVEIDPVTAPTATTVLLSGHIDTNTPPSEPSAADVHWHFECTPECPGLEGTVVLEGNVTATEDEADVEAEAKGLQPNTDYEVTLVAKNAGDPLSAGPISFKTEELPAPTITIDPVTTFTGTTAHFSGLIKPNTPALGDPSASNVLWHFECNPECPGLADEQTVAGAESEANVEANATGLEPNTTYQVTLLGHNIVHQASGGPASFKTNPVAPLAETIPAVAFGDGTEALIGGKVDPRNSATEYWLEYGPGPGGPSADYPSRIPVGVGKVPIPAQVTLTGDITAGLENGSDRVTNVKAPTGGLLVGQSITGPGIPPATKITQILPGVIVLSKGVTETAKAVSFTATGIRVVSQTVTGLTPATVYHFRIVAENISGTTQGNDISFETLPAPTPPPATCPNDRIRSETSSEALRECRAYEMTTPPDKNGGDTFPLRSSPDGNRLAFYANASFEGAEASTGYNSYVTLRDAGGWTTIPMMPGIGSEAPNLAFSSQYYPADFTEDLSESIAFSAGGGAEPDLRNVFSKNIDGSSNWVTAPTVDNLKPDEIYAKLYSGRSADGSHIVFESAQTFDPQWSGVGHQVWEWVDGHVRLVSIAPNGSPMAGGAGVGTGIDAGISSGTAFSGTLIDSDAVSEDGSKIFFGQGLGITSGVFVRIDGTETRELTRSQRSDTVGQSADGAFVGASADGNVAVFSSPQQLTEDATPDGGLYAYDLRTDILRFLSSGATDPSGPQVDGVSLISRDGSRVYFVARSVLVSGEGAPGAHNLYVSGPNGVSFIATLGANDAQDWYPNFGGGAQVTTRATPDGRYFTFQSREHITSFDSRGYMEIYLYDADHDTITCVSCGASAHVPGGDASIIASPVPPGGYQPYLQFGHPRTLTDDARRIVFQTDDALLPADVNGLSDVYLLDDGRLSLISTGSSKYDSEVADISPDGRDVFFTTRDSFVGQDIDGGSKDVYDARLDGGFPSPSLANPCENESACQGTPPAPPGFTSPPTVAPGRGNQPKHTKCKGMKKKKRANCGKRKVNKHRKFASNNGRGK